MYAQQIAKIELPSQPSPFALLDGAMAQPVSFFPAGTEIYAQGEKAGPLYQVEFGAVRVYRLLADGRRQISAFHLAGETFGFEADATHHFFAEAIGATGIRVFRIASTADMSSQLLPLALKGLIRAQEHLLVLGRQNAIERVAAFLVDMAGRQGGLRQIELPMSRLDIGDYLGLTIETVSRVFTRLKDKSAIRLLGLRSIEILKQNMLLEMGG
ncbi:helix-turn-helix domain-containing protein [Mesorhizobium opportunistum]|uniref:Helix-turn-helix domain-containing protein n=1 Tax=Mesorhizobium opportunistum TaxID=593909 RepID=A0ABV1YF98_9HYPH|nr:MULTISPECIES: helix-turn-helix domain-containing protein [Mesorhizobium]ESY63992.1 transcriptional regulator [Mesorhizobium sp. LNHC232B00]TIN96033.1 MAG: cyclic nucleotide-binding domain-containing protein [Mesorhizobium sp.]TJU93232.1 MAG: cyclic nucleotide-binding domain-containing protein [Mesorhizobium sp.]TJU99496.1 MAG: cyclic nucleotide-binding domain-containing protein [Mesorhizobium sp.]TJV18203.1 MAG: cyclic nucleotide-binding domain-containing protein [Mesorhizobium sp.]